MDISAIPNAKVVSFKGNTCGLIGQKTAGVGVIKSTPVNPAATVVTAIAASISKKIHCLACDAITHSWPKWLISHHWSYSMAV